MDLKWQTDTRLIILYQKESIRATERKMLMTPIGLWDIHCPKLPNYQGWRMRTFCIKSVSDNNINIEVLPTYLRTLVNHYHAEYGVGRVTNINTFSLKCSNHQDTSKKRCRQCRARRDTVKLVLMTRLKMEINSWTTSKRRMGTSKSEERSENHPRGRHSNDQKSI